MKILAVSENKSQSRKSDKLVFALYTITNQDEYICLSSYRNYWDARKRFLELKTICPDNIIYFVECSEEEYFKSLRKIRKHQARGFIQSLFKF